MPSLIDLAIEMQINIVWKRNAMEKESLEQTWLATCLIFMETKLLTPLKCFCVTKEIAVTVVSVFPLAIYGKTFTKWYIFLPYSGTSFYHIVVHLFTSGTSFYHIVVHLFTKWYIFLPYSGTSFYHIVVHLFTKFGKTPYHLKLIN